MIAENHREEEDQEGNNSPEIETLPLFPIHGGSQHDFFGVKASDLSSDHSVGVENHREVEDQEGNNSPEIETLPLFPIHAGSQRDFFGVKALDLSSNHSVGDYYTARMVGPHMDITTYFVSENHREEEDQEGNNSPEIETLPLFPIHGGSQHDFFGVKASDLSSDHSVGVGETKGKDRADNEPRGENEPSPQPKCTEPDKMQHPNDGRAWKNFDTKYPDFAEEPRNVRLGLDADDFNPFGNLSQSYCMWPVILTTYNLPMWLCMKESSFMLTLLIPGPKSPSKDINVYLRPLIDDLKDLWANPGVKTIDVATSQKFNMRAMVLWTINDFPVQSKTTYVGHRRFLKKRHKRRSSLDFNGQIKDGDPPREFSGMQS
ncbi:CACTA transposable element [Tanacetum coccineum]